MEKTGTQEKILRFGKKEFLAKGYARASLRAIAAAAGVTTGAIYTYFQNKNALFEAIVEPVCHLADHLLARMGNAYYNESGLRGEISSQRSVEDLTEIYKFIYRYFDEFRLLVVGAEGSARAGFVHSLVEKEVAHTLAYLDVIAKTCPINRGFLNENALHLVAESYINTLLEPVRHALSYEQALENLPFVAAFYTGGWQSVFGEMLCQ